MLQDSFGAWDTGLSWVDFDRLSDGASCAFEDGFGDMVGVSPVV
jgi:hypothetical protein